jgi:UDP-3-O-[3-hydroxymyristoyl] glucosamine N-acyltransferase
MNLKLGDIARELGAILEGDPEIPITGLAGLEEAGPGDLTFFADPRYASRLAGSRASAVLVGPEYAGARHPALLRVVDPYRGFLQIVRRERNRIRERTAGVHPTALVSSDAKVDDTAAVGPLCVVEAEAVLEPGVTLEAGCYVGRGARLGRDAHFHANVTVLDGVEIGERVIIHSGAVLGSDGFGYLTKDGVHEKVPQVGTVVVEDEVEIGANVTIDRGTLGTTRIGRGVKIDNLVHIAHNVTIGEHALIVAQVGVSGSTRIGPRVVLGGQVGIVGHIEIGEGAMVGAQAGVSKSVPAGMRVSGYPAMEHDRARRLNAYYRKLPKIMERLQYLEHRLAELEAGRETVG